MAEPVLSSIVDSIIGNVISLTSQEIRLACGVRAELEKLRNTVSAITALLSEADKRRVKSDDVKNWLEKLKDVDYDADDLLDDFSVEALRRRAVTGRAKRILNEVRAFFSPSNRIIYACKMAHQVMEIREKIDAIVRDKVSFKLKGSNSWVLVDNPVMRETHPFESRLYVIGRENDKEKVMNFLLSNGERDDVSILAIVGLGGLGKTTLARLVFNHEKVKENFALRLWVFVSTNFNVEDILRKVLRECTPDMNSEDLSRLNVNVLQRKLENELGGKRFLLVLDDVWNDNRVKWLELQGFLMNGAKGSKILVTTRTQRVASTMTRTFHALSSLPEAESLSLLMRVAMKEEHEWRNQNLETIAKEILKKCAGVPLAITTIGRLLLFSRNWEEDWLNFKNNDLSRISQEEGDIMPSLKLSYEFLPPNLKQCFAYCSLFPNDYELEPSELIHLWMAQGFIKSPGNEKSPKEVGHDYFMELLSRSFFQNMKEDMYGNIVQCKMHHLMHDLARSVVGDNCISIDVRNAKEIPDRARHVSVVDLEDGEFEGLEGSGRVRSLLFGFGNRKDIYLSNLDVSCFRKLRALVIRAVNVRVISDSIGKLKHLRSLDLSRNYALRSLPNSISKLFNLEILNLNACVRLERLPGGLTELVNLRHLDVRQCNSLTHMPRGIMRLTCLQELGLFVVGEKGNPDAASLNELTRLTGLRKGLTIQKLETLGSILDEVVDASLLMEKIPLQSLELKWRYLKEHGSNDEVILERLRPHPNLKGLGIEGYSGARLSSWVSQLDKLVMITIGECSRCTYIPPQDHLHFLKRIRLFKLANLEFIEFISDSGTTPPQSFFPSLEKLELEYLDKFMGWDRRCDMNVLEEESIQTEEESIQMEEEDSFLMMLIPAFSDKFNVDITACPRFSYLRGRHLHLRRIVNKPLRQLLRAVSTSSTTMAMMGNEDSLSAVTVLTISSADVEHLLVELFQSLPSLRYLKISDCPRLKSLPMREILRYLPALETLKICWCDELDLSSIDDDSSQGMHDLQLHGHSKLRYVFFMGIRRMASLPGWIQHLTSLEHLRSKCCFNMKALPGWFPRLTSLKHLEVSQCTEELSRRCQRNTGEDWPKISHIEQVEIDGWYVRGDGIDSAKKFGWKRRALI